MCPPAPHDGRSAQERSGNCAVVCRSDRSLGSEPALALARGWRSRPMPLATMEYVRNGWPWGGGALGAFNVIQLEHAEAIVRGAEASKRPVIMQVSENTAAYHSGLAPIGRACLSLAEAS